MLNITGQTRVLGSISNPAHHSKSQAMHTAAFAAAGLDKVFLAFEVQEGKLEEAVAGVKALDMEGFSVSTPFKREVIQYLDELTPVAKLCQSVNAVKNEDGKLTGTCTDGAGFVEALAREGIDIKGKKLVVLGAGGASTAISMEAGLSGASEVVIFNRSNSSSWERAMENKEKLIQFTDCKAACYPLEDEAKLEEELADADILVNGTSIGFGAQEGQMVLPNPGVLRKDLFVADAIFFPEQTPLLTAAKEAGCRCMNGNGMLLYQGAVAFKFWTGKEMPVEVAREAMERNTIWTETKKSE